MCILMLSSDLENLSSRNRLPPGRGVQMLRVSGVTGASFGGDGRFRNTKIRASSRAIVNYAYHPVSIDLIVRQSSPTAAPLEAAAVGFNTSDKREAPA